MGVIKVTSDRLKLIEINPKYSIEDIKVATEASLIIEL